MVSFKNLEQSVFRRVITRLKTLLIPYLTNILLISAVILVAGCQTAPVATEIVTESTTSITETVEEVEVILETEEPEVVAQTIVEADFYLGVDLSYVNEMDDCGAVYLENGVAQDAYQLFQNHGSNLVRVRLWHDPQWTDYSDYDDIVRTLTRAKQAGMATILDFHYSDNWADPGKQAIPVAWQEFDDEQLAQAVYDYTYQVLEDLYHLALMPEFVQVGNETNSGMLKPVMKLDWKRDAQLFNAGIRAVRDIGDKTNPNPKIILHVAQPENAGWWFREATQNNILDFDIIGLSYYPQWSAFPISDLGPHINYLRNRFDKEVMIVEVAYPWTTEAVDETAANILYQGVRGYPISIDGQRQFMIDVTQTLISNGAIGVVYWEPAWVSTQCSTRWGQGSHWENATFFDFKNNNELHAGVEFLSYEYLFPELIVNGAIDDRYGEPLAQDEIGDNYTATPHLDLVSLHATHDESFLSLAITIAGDILKDPWGSYLVYFDTTEDDQGADIDVDRRPITINPPYLPEYRLDILALDRKGTVTGTFVMNVWDGEAWGTQTTTFGIAMKNGTPSVIEIQIPRSDLGNPDFVNLSVVTTGRGRIHTAGDILGTNLSPEDWSQSVVIDQFYRIDLTEN
ncbi:MAG TPA: glycosyl hydrolase 53 family protein [Anaerolineaceae bacterium]|nr:glycosyl hydrolase 53 family protein [Anaerolineaceae bacterium]